MRAPWKPSALLQVLPMGLQKSLEVHHQGSSWWHHTGLQLGCKPDAAKQKWVLRGKQYYRRGMICSRNVPFWFRTPDDAYQCTHPFVSVTPWGNWAWPGRIVSWLVGFSKCPWTKVNAVRERRKSMQELKHWDLGIYLFSFFTSHCNLKPSTKQKM